MSDRKPPILDVAVLCSEVVRDGNDNVFALNEPLHTVVIPPNGAGRLAAPDFLLFVQMADWEAQGTYVFRVEVRTDTNIFIPDQPAGGVSVTFVRHYYPLAPFEHVFRITGLVFPHPGRYHFHVMCNLVSMSAREECARPPKLYVIRGEPGGATP